MGSKTYLNLALTVLIITVAPVSGQPTHLSNLELVATTDAKSPAKASDSLAISPVNSSETETSKNAVTADPANETNSETSTPPISEEKRALVKELLSQMDADKNVELIINSLLEAQKREYPKLLKQFVSADTTLTADQKTEIESHMQERSDRALTRMKQLFDKNINLPRVMEEVAYKVYDKHFTCDELRDILAYYKTPTGKKALRVMPQIMQESMDQTRTIITPQIQKCIVQFIDEERTSLHSPITK